MLTMIQLEQCIEVNIDANIPTMVWGAPGIGKSDLVKSIAKKRNIGLIDFRATLRDPVDMRGLPLVDAKSGTSRWLPPNELPQEGRDGKQGILFMDELPQAAAAMQTACFSLVLDRYVGEYHLPKGWAVVAAGNRLSDRSGSTRMLSALANRFAHFEVVPDVDAWSDWAAKVSLNPLVVAFVRFRSTFLHRMPEADEKSFPTPRAWASVAKIANVKDETIRLQLVTALVGEAAAVEFEGFVRVWQRLPSIDAILKDPRSVHVPDMGEPALLYAVATAIARRVTKQNFANGLAYAKRLPPEFEIMCAVDAVRRDPNLKETKAFGDWFTRHSEVLI